MDLSPPHTITTIADSNDDNDKVNNNNSQEDKTTEPNQKEEHEATNSNNNNNNSDEDEEDSEDDIDGPTALNTVYNLLNELIDLNWDNRRKAERLVTKFSELHNAVLIKEAVTASENDDLADNANTSTNHVALHTSPNKQSDSNNQSLESDYSQPISSPSSPVTPTVKNTLVDDTTVPDNMVTPDKNRGNNNVDEEKQSTPLPISLYANISSTSGNQDHSSDLPADDGTPRPMVVTEGLILTNDFQRQQRPPSLSTTSGTLLSSEGMLSDSIDKDYKLQQLSRLASPIQHTKSLHRHHNLTIINNNNNSNNNNLQVIIQVLKEQ